MTKSEIAVKKHAEGYNCCQAVACTFAGELGLDESLLYKLGEGFGGGMGTGKGVCGAMCGAAMLAGLVNSDGDIEHAGQTKRISTAAAGRIQKEFEEKAGALLCKDIKTGNNGRAFSSCAECISIAAELAEKELGL